MGLYVFWRYIQNNYSNQYLEAGYLGDGYPLQHAIKIVANKIAETEISSTLKYSGPDISIRMYDKRNSLVNDHCAEIIIRKCGKYRRIFDFDFKTACRSGVI